MLSNLKSVDWEDLSEAIPAFSSLLFFMGFSYSITYGIAAGFLTYTLVKIVKGQAKDVHFIMWILISCLSLTSSVWLCSQSF